MRRQKSCYLSKYAVNPLYTFKKLKALFRTGWEGAGRIQKAGFEVASTTTRRLQ
jgi:hypothetical protein